MERSNSQNMASAKYTAEGIPPYVLKNKKAVTITEFLRYCGRSLLPRELGYYSHSKLCSVNWMRLTSVSCFASPFLKRSYRAFLCGKFGWMEMIIVSLFWPRCSVILLKEALSLVRGPTASDSSLYLAVSGCQLRTRRWFYFYTLEISERGLLTSKIHFWSFKLCNKNLTFELIL